MQLTRGHSNKPNKRQIHPRVLKSTCGGGCAGSNPLHWRWGGSRLLVVGLARVQELGRVPDEPDHFRQRTHALILLPTSPYLSTSTATSPPNTLPLTPNLPLMSSFLHPPLSTPSPLSHLPLVAPSPLHTSVFIGGHSRGRGNVELRARGLRRRDCGWGGRRDRRPGDEGVHSLWWGGAAQAVGLADSSLHTPRQNSNVQLCTAMCGRSGPRLSPRLAAEVLWDDLKEI